MEAPRAQILGILGCVLIGISGVGVLDAVFIHPTCEMVLNDVMVCTANTSRIVPSVLLLFAGMVILFGAIVRRYGPGR